jgi:hypothetical protein
MTISRSIAALLCAGVLASCGLYDKNAVQSITGPTTTNSRIKFHNFSPGSVGVNFFANNVKMSAISSSRCVAPVPADTLACKTTGIEATAGVAYAALGSGGLYAAIAPAQYTIASKIATTETVVSTVTQTIADGKYYSFFMSGIYNTTAQTAEAFIVEDPIPSGTIDFSTAYVRFVNAVSNGTGPTTLYAKNTTTSAETAVGAAVAYKAAGAFTALPEGIYDVGARYAGQTTNVTGLSRTTLNLVGGRVYTITALGNTATASTMSLDFTSNQR